MGNHKIWFTKEETNIRLRDKYKIRLYYHFKCLIGYLKEIKRIKDYKYYLYYDLYKHEIILALLGSHEVYISNGDIDDFAESLLVFEHHYLFNSNFDQNEENFN